MLAIGLSVVLMSICTMSENGPQQFEFSYSNDEYNELDLFRRYSLLKKMRPATVGIAFSDTSWIEFRCDDKTKNELVLGFRLEYGIDLKSKDKNGHLHLDFHTYVIKCDPQKSPAEVMAGFDKSSLMFNALRFQSSQGKLLTTDRITQIDYGVRPWITKDIRVTEMVFGEVHVLRDGIPKDIRMEYVRS